MPPGWEACVCPNGRSVCLPVPQSDGFETCAFLSMVASPWECLQSVDHRPYFVDHNTHTTHWSLPGSGAYWHYEEEELSLQSFSNSSINVILALLCFRWVKLFVCLAFVKFNRLAVFLLLWVLPFVLSPVCVQTKTVQVLFSFFFVSATFWNDSLIS